MSKQKAPRASAVREQARLDAERARERKMLKVWVAGALALAVIVAGAATADVVLGVAHKQPAGS